MDNLETSSHIMECENIKRHFLLQILICKIHSFDQVFSLPSPWHYSWSKLAILQDHPVGSPMVKGINYPAKTEV